MNSAFLDKHLELDATPGNTAFMTFSGHAFDIFDPSTWVFDITDIAQSLGNVCRFGGHVYFYSVAEHSVRVAEWLRDRGHGPIVQMLGLMHDSIEAYIGDIIRPIKKYADLGGEKVTDLEKSMEYALFSAYDLLTPTFDANWELVKQGDMAVFDQERKERPTVGRNLDASSAKQLWLDKFNKLQALIG